LFVLLYNTYLFSAFFLSLSAFGECYCISDGLSCRPVTLFLSEFRAVVFCAPVSSYPLSHFRLRCCIGGVSVFGLGLCRRRRRVSGWDYVCFVFVNLICFLTVCIIYVFLTVEEKTYEASETEAPKDETEIQVGALKKLRLLFKS